MNELFLKVVNMSVSASYLVLAVLVLRLILKKAPKWVNVLLWGIVAVRLICPFSIESALSLIPSAEPVPEQVVADLVVDTQGKIPQTNIPSEDKTDLPVRDDQPVTDVTDQETKTVPLGTVLSTFWIAGVGAMLAYTAVSYFLLRRKVDAAVLLQDNIYQSENVDSPFVLGVIRPKIYLPFRMDGQSLTHVIAHEKAHIRRKDHWWKPLGFVLLAIHWFNPIVWIGYILLCRDIELACDEKVIRQMDNQTKADYTEALVACSVNRRVIAACPLAFGEVGVKERVKTVMNYKKPAFWIVIAAVTLCVAVAVCFLTDPKTESLDLQVGDPTMLEFPGVEWFVTPEKLKEALNITEEQIIDEYMDAEKADNVNDYDTHHLMVKDLTLFGKEVTYGQFAFRRYPGYDFAFDYAIVSFAEDTDMEALKAEVSEIYGPGVGETYTYFMYEKDIKRDYTYKPRMMQELEYYANSGYKLDDVEGNPYKDALEDPEYMTHLWVTENGTSVIPEEVVEYFEYMMDQPYNADNVASQDDVKLMEMLDSWPWITISMSNRCAATIRSEAKGYKGEPYSYYTNNYMEFNAQWLWGYLYTSKVFDQNTAAVDDPSLLEFPGLKWGMTVDEVKSALAIQEDQILTDQQIISSVAVSKTYDEWALYVKDLAAFDTEVTLAMFTFISRAEDQIPEGQEYLGHTAGEFVLQGVKVFLDEETDMEKLEQDMTAVYGEGVGGTYMYTDAFSTGNLNKTAINANPYARALSAFWEALNDPNYQEQMWICTDPAATSESMRSYLIQMLSNNGHSEEDIRDWLNQSPWVTLRLVNHSYEALRIELGDYESKYKEYMTRNALEYRTNTEVCIAQMNSDKE